jgi:hypothetical protein
MTIRLRQALAAWETPGFEDVLKKEVEALPPDQLPLQQGLSAGSHALDDKPSVMVIAVSETAAGIRAKLGIFYSSVVAGCSCADDPTPVSELSEYCQVQLDIDKATAEATVTLLAEP